MKPIRYIRTLNMTTLSMCGLDPEMNMLESPRCDCGCGGKGRFLFDDRSQLFQFMANTLVDFECEQCGIFAVKTDGTLYWSAKIGTEYEDVKFYSMDAGADYPKCIKEVFDTFELHCYGLLVEAEPGEWEIIDE